MQRQSFKWEVRRQYPEAVCSREPRKGGGTHWVVRDGKEKPKRGKPDTRAVLGTDGWSAGRAWRRAWSCLPQIKEPVK